MLSTLEEIVSSSIALSFDFLCREAEEAHLAGDGLKVNHITTIALSSIRSNDQSIAKNKLTYSKVRWAYLFAIYWASDGWLRLEINESLKQFDEFADSSDEVLLQFLLNAVMNCASDLDSSALLDLDKSWFQKHSQESFDVAAITFAIELIWNRHPETDNWKILAENWIGKIKSGTNLALAFAPLIERLKAQSDLYGGSDSLSDQSEKCGLSFMQQLLVKAWGNFFNCEIPELKNSLEKIVKSGLSVDSPNYSSFWTLSHFSRFERMSKECQYVSLTRIAHLEARRPVQIDQLYRDRKFHATYSALAVSGFSDGDASERLDCLRLAMKSQIHALRRWDFGDWIAAERNKAKIYLELGSKGTYPFFCKGIEFAARSFGIPEKGKFLHLDRCLDLLDSLDELQRIDFVNSIICLPKTSWSHSLRIFRELSDAIPNVCLASLAEWTLKVEKILGNQVFGGQTSLDIWTDILPFVGSSDAVTKILKERVYKIASSSRYWHQLEDFLFGWLIHVEESLAEQTLKVLFDAECSDHERKIRIHLVLNCAKNRSELLDICKPWLKLQVESGDDIFDAFLVDHLDSIGNVRVADKRFFDEFRQKILDYCDKQLSPNSKSISIGTFSFHHFFQFVKFSRTDTVLVERLSEVIDCENVPYFNKIEAIACLAHLVKYGPKIQAERIYQSAIPWLENGIKGRDIGQRGGPLSSFQTKGMSPDSTNQTFLMLLDAFAHQVPDKSRSGLAEWVVSKAVICPPAYADSVIRICLLTSLSFANKKERAASMIAMAAAVGQSAFTSAPQRVIHGFGSILLPEENVGEAKDHSDALIKTICGEIFFGYLRAGSKLADYFVRRSVAIFVSRWLSKSPQNFKTELEELRSTLLMDARQRVRDPLEERNKN